MGEMIGLEDEIGELLGLLTVATVEADEGSGQGRVGATPEPVAGLALVQRGTAAGVMPGEVWPCERGDVRWRLSSRGTMSRMSDDVDLAHLLGTATAGSIVRDFLMVRPTGGRVFVDEEGNATTPIENKLFYLGNIGLARTSNHEPLGNDLRSALTTALLQAPLSTARELAYELRRCQGVTATKSEINSLLYRDKGFLSDGGGTARWRVSSSVTSVTPPVSASAATATAPKRRTSPAATYGDLVVSAQPSPKHPVPTRAASGARLMPPHILDLMEWQREAIAAWYANSCHGIVEAVTGTGKTHLGLEAVAQAHRDGEKSTVLVPSVDLQDQWVDRFASFLPSLRVARLGGRKSGDARTADVTIAVVNSALLSDLSGLSADSLLVADEVHRYGADQFQYALRAKYQRRLGLTATLERSGDDAVAGVLSPYFGGTILKVDFDRAIREGVVAPFRLVMAPIALDEDEQAEYDGLSRQISNGLKVLRGHGAIRGGGANIAQELGRLRGAGGEVGKAARMAETAMRKRRQFLASASGKLEAIEELSEMVGASQGTVIFTQSKDVAESAALVLREWGVPASPLHSDMNDRERRESLDGLASGRLQALAAPKLLDEGIDVPTVDLGIVMTASRSRRQMVQRLGRVIRRKDDGRPVDFVILYAEDTVEDPSSGVHEGFFDLVGEVAAQKVTLEVGWTANDLVV